MKIKLPWVDEIDSMNPPENLQEIVWNSFRQFTEGTAKDYRYVDKLSYVDNLRKIIHGNKPDDEVIENLIGAQAKYQLEEYGEMPETSDILSVEFMETCYKEGFRPFYLSLGKHHYETLLTISEIIKFVMNYEEIEGR